MKRSFGLDLIRALAAILVIMVHVFLNRGYYENSMDNVFTYFYLYIRNFAFICVPLFMLLTGYCNSNKKIEKKYYLSLKKIIIIYLLISMICIPFRYFYLKDSRLIDLIIGVFQFKTNKYAWYVEMYIGLFLLIPFINTLYKNLENKKEKQILIVILLLICSIPSTLQEIIYHNRNMNILPGWWTNIYPFLYYVIGLYIKEYQPKIKKIKLLEISIITLILQTNLNTLQCMYSTIFTTTKYQSIFTVIISTSIFLLFYDIKYEKEKITKLVQTISINSLGIYLFSYIFDYIYYQRILFHDSINRNLFYSLIIMTPLILLSSLISSIALNKLIEISTKVINHIRNKKESE